MTKTKRNVRPLLLTSSIASLLGAVLCTIAATLLIMRNVAIEHGKDFPIKSRWLYNSYYFIGVVFLVGFVCAMIFIGFRKHHSTTSKTLSTQNLIILNSAFWGVTIVLILLTVVALLKTGFEIGQLTRTEVISLLWYITAVVMVPIGIINLISAIKIK